jgi:bis(5'-adenosyl)-triphosphatase
MKANLQKNLPFLSIFAIVNLFLLPPATSMTSPSPPSTTTTTTTTLDMRFGKFLIPSSHVFYRTQRSAAFVNLRPIVPGHVLIMPERIVATMEELTEEEYLDMWTSVRTVQRILKQHYSDTTAFNVAVQDGRAAGQSVPHVHVHVLPRTGGDFERNDDVYEELEQWSPRDELKETKMNGSIDVPGDEDRVDRTDEMMANEAALYRSVLEKEEGASKL